MWSAAPSHGRGERDHEVLLGDGLERAGAARRADRGDGRVWGHPGGDQGTGRNGSAPAKTAHAGHHDGLASLGRLAAPVHEFDSVGGIGYALVGDGQTAVGEARGLGPGAEAGDARPGELGVGQQAQEPGGPLGPELRQIGAQVASPVPPPGAQGDTEPARPEEIGFNPVHPQGQLPADRAGDLIGKRARRSQRRLLLERGRLGEAKGVDRVTQQRHLEL